MEGGSLSNNNRFPEIGSKEKNLCFELVSAAVLRLAPCSIGGETSDLATRCAFFGSSGTILLPCRRQTQNALLSSFLMRNKFDSVSQMVN